MTRTADLVTDAFRALALRIMGYRTDVVEFISPEHTARNLMIRAVRGAPTGEVAVVSEYLEMRRFWGVTNGAGAAPRRGANRAAWVASLKARNVLSTDLVRRAAARCCGVPR